MKTKLKICECGNNKFITPYSFTVEEFSECSQCGKVYKFKGILMCGVCRNKSNTVREHIEHVAIGHNDKDAAEYLDTFNKLMGAGK